VIAQKIGFEKESYRRIKAGIVFTLQEASNEGHVYLPKQQLMEKAATVLDVDWEKVLFSLDQLVVEQRAIAEDNKIYLPLFFRAETICAEILDKKIRFGRNAAPTYNRESVDRWVVAYTTNVSFEPDVRQIQAIHTALSSSIMIMTGGPGTGKTTTIQVMVAFFRAHHLRIALCAPTGRAAQRMGNLAGVSARTIHRLLEYNPKKPGNPFTRNEHNPLDTDVLICDEVSMIDILLMKQLLQAIRPQTIVIFVGDNNQLPSIGPGNVLGDMIQSERIPHCVLTTIFRQAAKSRIVTAAHQIIHGSIPEFSNEKSDNCFFIQKNSPQECIASIIELVTERLPHAYSIDPVRDIQVVSPMHRGELGTLEINRILQSHLNKSTEKLTRGETSFSSGDKVMQIRNNYETEVFNGDIGYVAKILDDKGLLVDFGDKVVPYLLKDLEELVHAYCISIHKSQGCEFNTVIIPIMTQHYIMLQRNLIYTALTRARQRCIFVGTLKALSIGIANNQAQHRYCYLSQRIKRSEKIN
jgi:exodeoxyribonuclease V alpha subunit